MRTTAFMLVLSAMALAGCDTAELNTPDPDASNTEAGNGAPVPMAGEPGAVQLSAEGLTVTGPLGTTLPFDTARATVEAELTKFVGAPLRRGSNAECGAGPVDTTAFHGGLTLNFQKDTFAGWEYEGDRKNDISTDIATDKGIDIGATETELIAAYGENKQPDSTLGVEFFSENGVGGFLGGDVADRTVTSLYAGVTCFFR